jgi:hypothetical protein
MTSRRKFVLKSSLAALALVATKPMNVMASAVSRFQRLTGSSQKLILLHTGKIKTSLLAGDPANLIRRISSSENVLLMNVSGTDHTAMDYDLVLHEMKAQGKEYVIVNRNGIRTGLVSAEKDDARNHSRIETLAKHLKADKDCQLVVCISSLGFKNRSGMDDCALAAGSSELDVIITAHPNNYNPRTLTVRNKIRGEVIIQSSLSKQDSFGAMELQFDIDGKKNRVSLVKGLPGSHAA